MSKKLVLVSIAVLLFVVGCGPRNSDHIYFTSDRDGLGYNLYSMKVEGGELVQLTTDLSLGWYSHCSLSLDGSQLVFVAELDGDSELYLMDSDGGNRVKLTDNEIYEDRPTFTPDGRISYDSEVDGDWEIWVMDADGGNPTRLTYSTGVDEGSAWSPDGKRIAFASERDGWYGIYVMNADGSAVEKLFGEEYVWANDPAWSPDGTKLAISSNINGSEDIVILELASGEFIGLTGSGDEGYFAERYPVWSMDGKQIAFFVTEGGDSEIYTINADGTNRKALTTNEDVVDFLPYW
ncbi:DUF5050 domain-containing protein [bacterium]|nr:DUF5050 domain-containing protein [bacterium]